MPSNIFDAIIIISTIEHIGLKVYKQKVESTDGDIIALNEMKRILKPNGFLILTTPYIGNAKLRVNICERQYNRNRLNTLIKGMKVTQETYFYPLRTGRQLIWVKSTKREMDNTTFHKEPGIACMILQK